MKELVSVQELKLANSKDGVIKVGIVYEPYGNTSLPVASVAINLNSHASEPDWKVHIPKENIDELCKALQKAKEEM